MKRIGSSEIGVGFAGFGGLKELCNGGFDRRSFLSGNPLIHTCLHTCETRVLPSLVVISLGLMVLNDWGLL